MLCLSVKLNLKKKDMNFKLELLKKELELELKREEKNKAILTQQYDQAATIREEEKLILLSIDEMIHQVEKMFNETILTSENFHQQKEYSKLLMRYYVITKNVLLKEKITASIKYYNKIRTIELSNKNKLLYINMGLEIECLKTYFKDYFSL